MAGNRYLECEGMRRLYCRCLALASLVANTAIADYQAHEDASGDAVVDVMTRFWDWYYANDFRWYLYPNEDPCLGYSDDVVGFGDWIGQGYPGSPPTRPTIEISTNLWRLWMYSSQVVYSVTAAISVIAEYTNSAPGGLVGIPYIFTERDLTKFQCIYTGQSAGLWYITTYAKRETATPTSKLMNQIGDILRVHLQQNSIRYDTENPAWTNGGCISEDWQDQFLYPTNDFVMNSLGLATDELLTGGSHETLTGENHPGMEYVGVDAENSDSYVNYYKTRHYSLLTDHGIEFLGVPDVNRYSLEGIREYSFQKNPHRSRLGSFSMKTNTINGIDRISSYSWGGGYVPKITVVSRTWRNVAFIPLIVPCGGDWGWYCFPSETMYDEERNEWTTGDRWYTEISYYFEEPSDPDVAKMYYVNAGFKIVVTNSGETTPNTFTKGGTSGVGFLARPENPQPPQFLMKQ